MKKGDAGGASLPGRIVFEAHPDSSEGPASAFTDQRSSSRTRASSRSSSADGRRDHRRRRA
ncbi:MAG: hypothetical protein MZW92_56400 [Comamonadaceae bacterium]|nr:hypothetical protein [Comamonadaceae bacterium]